MQPIEEAIQRENAELQFMLRELMREYTMLLALGPDQYAKVMPESARRLLQQIMNKTDNYITYLSTHTPHDLPRQFPYHS